MRWFHLHSNENPLKENKEFALDVSNSGYTKITIDSKWDWNWTTHSQKKWILERTEDNQRAERKKRKNQKKEKKEKVEREKEVCWKGDEVAQRNQRVYGIDFHQERPMEVVEVVVMVVTKKGEKGKV